jgi:metal-responsive CopG/Arc/MetJ family transcriptional regulator
MLIVEIFNNGPGAMATMNFSIPDDVKDEFNEVFEGENKSAVITGLMRRAIEERQQRAKQDDAFDALMEELLRARAQDPPMSDEEIRRIRVEGRP